MEPDHLTPAETAAVLKLKSTGTLSNWRMQGKGPRWIKHGPRVLYPIAAVRDYVETNFKDPFKPKRGTK